MSGAGMMAPPRLGHDTTPPVPGIDADGNPERWRVEVFDDRGNLLCKMACQVEDDLGHAIILSGDGDILQTGFARQALVYSDLGLRARLDVVSLPYWVSAPRGKLKIAQQELVCGNRLELNDITITWGD